MGIEPRKIGERITYWQEHIAPFTSNAVAIGTTTGAVTDLQTKTEAAQEALVAQATAKMALKAATANLKTAVRAMSNAGMAIVDQIRGKARIAGGDAIYNLAEVAVPATPGTIGPPGTPTNCKAEVLPNGTLVLGWKCENPAGSSGTVYQLSRQLGGTGPFVYLGGTGRKKFEDDSIPEGTSLVTYAIQAVRSTAVGVEQQFTVKFGPNVSGGTVTTVVNAPARLAA